MVRAVAPKLFCIDPVAVSNERFAAFVDATAFVADAERFGWSERMNQGVVHVFWQAMFFDLGSDPGEHYNLFDRKLDMGWMFGVVLGAIAEYRASIAKYPNIEPGSEFNGYPAEESASPRTSSTPP